MTSFVSTGDLTDYMSGIGLDADQAGSAQDVLDGLQRQLERYCQRPLVRMDRTETLWPDELGRIWPTATPIESISAPLELVPYYNQVGTSYGVFGNMGPLSVFDTGPVTITYVGGVSGKDEADIRLAILRAAAREVDARHSDVLDEQDLSQRPAQPSDKRVTGFTDDELRQFDRLRRRTVV
jgi:hypothetical protein